MNRLFELVIMECQAAISEVAVAMEHLSHEDQQKLDHALHKAHQRVWKVEAKSRGDWFNNTRFATDPFVRRIAYIQTAGFFLVVGMAWMMGIPEKGHDMLVGMIGALITTQAGITAFCFGSNSNAHRTDAMLYHATPTKTNHEQP